MIKEICHFPYELIQAKKTITAFYELKRSNLIKNGLYKLHLYGKPIMYNSNAIDMLYKYPAKYSGLFGKLSFTNDSPLNNNFQADCFMLLAEGECKLFDLTNNIVYTKLKKNKKDRIIRGNSLFQEYFNTTIIKEDEDGIFEKYIDYHPAKQLQASTRISLMEDLTLSYIGFSHHNKSTGTRSKDQCIQDISSLKTKGIIEIANRIVQYIPDGLLIPTIFQHGDMHFGNILYDDNKMYIIDFEMFREELFYYDLLNCCYVEVVDNNKFDLFNWYLSEESKANSLFEKLFSEMDVEYFPSKRVGYFGLFLLRRIYTDVCRARKRLSQKNAIKYSEYLVRKNREIIKRLEDKL